MSSWNNQETPVKLHKNERFSANQVSDGGLPVVPVTTGKNYYSENDASLPKLYDIPIHVNSPNSVAIWIDDVPTLAKLIDGTLVLGPPDTMVIRPNFNGIGLWFNKSNETGQIGIQVFLAFGVGPLFAYYSLLETDMVLKAADIDAKEELILKLALGDIQVPMTVGAPAAIVIVITPAMGYDTTHPIFLGRQNIAPTGIRLYPAILSPTTIELGAVYDSMPCIRIYPTVERGMRLSDAEGNVIKPGIPFDMMLELQKNWTSADDPASLQDSGILFSLYRFPPGSVRAGRLRRVRIALESIAGGTAPNHLILRLYRNSTHLLGDQNEFFLAELTVPQDTYVLTANADYAQIDGFHMTKLGLRIGMFIDKAGAQTGSIYKIEEGYEVIGGILTPRTRIWAQNIGVAPFATLTWAVADNVTFNITPKPLWGASYQWNIEIPYQTYWILTPDYSVYYELFMSGASAPDTLVTRILVHIEEDNMLLRVNPSRSIAGSEDEQRKW